MHRVRVGALGLAGVFLLVMLATAFLRGASGGADNATMRAANTAASAPAEPLAQLGVAPGGDDPAPAPRHSAHAKARH